MTDVTVRNFSKQGTGRSTNFTYSSGKLDKLKHHSIRYGYSYSGNDITKVNRWHESNDTILGTCFEREIIKGTDNNTTVTTHYPLNTSSRLYQIKEIYDKYGRLSSIDGVLENTYDSFPAFNNNQLVPTVDNKDGLLAVSKDITLGTEKHYTYANNKIRSVQTVNSSTSSILNAEAYTYDNCGRLTENLYADSYGEYNSTYEYVHPVGNIKADNRISKLRYKINGAEKALTEYSYDSYKRVYQKKYTLGSRSFRKNLSFNSSRISNVVDRNSSTIVHNTAYTYDNLGRITAETDSVDTNRNVTYQYDAFGQLVRENNKLLDKTLVYSYNSVGNITSVKTYAYTTGTVSGTYTEQTYTYSTTYADRLTNFNGQSISYNSCGCPTSYGDKTFTWNNGKLASAANSNNTYHYNYNAQGQRTSKRTTQFSLSAVTDYTYDNNGRLISEIYNLTGKLPITTHTAYLYDDSGVIGMVYDSVTYYFGKNLQGDITEIYDTSGNLVVKYGYDAFGNCSVLDGTTNASLASANHIRYRGYYYDEETGFYCLGARYYDPNAKRFISPDDTSYIDPKTPNGLNLYCYCGNDPVNYIDPSGHIATAVLIAISILAGTAIAGGVIGGVVASQNESVSMAEGIIVGTAIGLAAGGLIVSGAGAVITIINGGIITVGGISTLQIFAIGALAYNFSVLVILPIFGIKMDPIEYEDNSYKPPIP